MSNSQEQTITHCPECRQALEQGQAYLLSGMIAGAAYLCRRCRVIYTPDRKLLARMVG
jgi:hypothetical protein